jgi:hypothetical protein
MTCPPSKNHSDKSCVFCKPSKQCQEDLSQPSVDPKHVHAEGRGGGGVSRLEGLHKGGEDSGISALLPTHKIKKVETEGFHYMKIADVWSLQTFDFLIEHREV